MAENLTLGQLNKAVKGTAAAFRCRRRLQPAGGEGDKVFPPTFAGAVYAIEQRRVPGREQAVTCVLLDSVQSQANRMELALQDAMDEGKIIIPLLMVDFTEYGPTGDVAGEVELGEGLDGRHPGAGDRSGPGTSVRLQHVAVECQRAVRERLEVDPGSQAAADQALDLGAAP